jgi:uncharacterized protein YbjT (DUF2867 family)
MFQSFGHVRVSFKRDLEAVVGMRTSCGVLLALAWAGNAAAFAPMHGSMGLRRPKATGAQAARMLVGVPKEVLVTGAAGRTGFLTFTKMREMEKEFFVKGFVHNEKSAQKLERTGASLGDSPAIQAQNKKLREMGMPADDEEPEVFVGDIRNADDLKRAMDQCDALVILTSGVPKLRKREIFKTLLSKIIGRQRMPNFYYNDTPEQIDWIGAKQQIDVAKEMGVNHIVLVSSMGVSPSKNTPDNTLNKIGGGNILVWKAKAEEYLANCGVDYTIIHPGGLSNKVGGEREIVVGVNDDLLDNFESLGATRSIPRADVAEVATIPCGLW